MSSISQPPKIHIRNFPLNITKPKSKTNPLIISAFNPYAKSLFFVTIMAANINAASNINPPMKNKPVAAPLTADLILS